MHKILMILFATLLLVNPPAKSNDLIIPLDGKWQIRLDREDVGIRDSWYRQEFKDTINLPDELQPSIQLIDTWFEARRLALLFEGKIDKGKIIVTFIDFQNHLENRLAARQLYASLLYYMTSKSFAPAMEITAESIQKLYK